MRKCPATDTERLFHISSVHGGACDVAGAAVLPFDVGRYPQTVRRICVGRLVVKS